jgi:hypothetical protein
MVSPETHCGDQILVNTWTWIFSFSAILDAMRFVLGTQVGFRSENWQEGHFSWFPETSYGAHGQLVFRGPRVSMLIHSIPRSGQNTGKELNSAELISAADVSGLASGQEFGTEYQQGGSILAVRQDRRSTEGCALSCCKCVSALKAPSFAELG